MRHIMRVSTSDLTAKYHCIIPILKCKCIIFIPMEGYATIGYGTTIYNCCFLIHNCRIFF